MAAVFGPLSDIEPIVAEVDSYVVVANITSNTQAVIGGATTAAVAAGEFDAVHTIDRALAMGSVDRIISADAHPG